MNTTLWQRLQAIDRRIIYAILLAFILVPLFDKHLSLPIIPSQESQQFYDTIEGIASNPATRNKMVIMDGWWSPSTRGENQWQTQAIITHLMRRRLRFAFISFDPQNNTVVQLQIVDPLAKQYHYVYGQDYVNWGYRPQPAFIPLVKGLVTNIPGAIKKDYKGVDISSFPAMRGIKTMGDVSAVIDVTPSQTAETWLGLGGLSASHTAFLFSPTAVMAPTYYPYLDSGQMAGMLTGIKGAGDYESLLGTHQFGRRATGALSLVYSLIILLIILGNVGFYANRAAERRAAA